MTPPYTEAGMGYAPPMPMPKPGDIAPDFTCQDHRGEMVRLEELKGHKVVLFFYPKASTPG